MSAITTNKNYLNVIVNDASVGAVKVPNEKVLEFFKVDKYNAIHFKGKNLEKLAETVKALAVDVFFKLAKNEGFPQANDEMEYFHLSEDLQKLGIESIVLLQSRILRRS
jgi:hypothetical protein